MIATIKIMDGVLLSVMAFAAIFTTVFSAAVLLIAGSLTAAALLPRAHPGGDRLRAFAGKISRSVWHVTCRLDALIFVCALVLAAILTFVFS
ncbi:hypothetical protein ACSFA3_20320 [Variovorax sp. RHLX14]|uniref:hypothetical protein n=1 Tax=Variovorax sp. RHLX14 TaxID=1259731 RepID=UPI003F474F5B